MVTFMDGPVAGQGLAIRRAPIFLRVVRGPRGKLDALDQLDDEPRENERIYVYRKRLDLAHGHVCVRPGGCFPTAHYQHVPMAPVERLRETEAWRAWVDAQPVEGLGLVK